MERGRPLQLVGREAELAWLEGQAMRRTPLYVSVEGHPGAGRTTLLRVLADRLVLRGHPIVWVDGAELPTSDPTHFMRVVREGVARKASRGGVVFIDDGDVLATRLPKLVADLSQDHATPRVPLFVGSTPGGRPALAPLFTGRACTELAVPDLSPAAILTYLQRRQVAVEDGWDVVSRTHGHPLLVALIADIAVTSGQVHIPAGDFDHVVARLSCRLIRGVPHIGIRVALAALAVSERMSEVEFISLLGAERVGATVAGLQRIAVVDENVAGFALHPTVAAAIRADHSPATQDLLEQTRRLLKGLGA